jgi:cation transport protein ChaC
MDANFDHTAEDLGYSAWLADVAAGLRYVERAPAPWLACTDRFAFIPLATAARRKAGLVLGLDRGGACRGIAYRVAASERPRRLPTYAIAN